MWLLNFKLISIIPKNSFLKLDGSNTRESILVSCRCYFYNCLHLFARVKWPGIWNITHDLHLFSCLSLSLGNNPVGYFISLRNITFTLTTGQQWEATAMERIRCRGKVCVRDSGFLLCLSLACLLYSQRTPHFWHFRSLNVWHFPPYTKQFSVTPVGYPTT